MVFAGIPLGHEFTSLVLALLQVSGRTPKVEQKVINQIKSIKGEYHFETYISLSCHNCPDVVQALNLLSILNHGITHVMIDGAAFKEEVESKNILAVPSIYLNDEFFGSGRMTLEEILAKMGNSTDPSEFTNKEPFDVLIVGGGPAGASAAIYAARKGIRTGIVAERFGGQVMETLGIENLIGVKYTEGPKLVASIEEHVKEYNVDIMNLQRAKSLEKKELIEVELENGAVLKSKNVILATGARWRNVGVPGEKEFRNNGVAYCPHCDGLLFKGKDVAVNGVSYVERDTGEAHHIELQGVFILIGLVPNTDWLGDTVERNRFDEIIVDKRGATNIPGVFAAGDCTDSPYKQIIISMGTGASAALSAFDYLIREALGTGTRPLPH